MLARRRAEVEREEAIRAEARKLARAFLQRRRDPEPGSIELPRFLWEWVTNGKEDTFDLTDLGVLAGVLYCFANESAALFAKGRFEADAEGPRIFISDAGAGVPLARGADDGGRLQVRHSLDALRRNGWVETARRGGTLTITPGARMRKLWPS